MGLPCDHRADPCDDTASRLGQGHGGAAGAIGARAAHPLGPCWHGRPPRAHASLLLSFSFSWTCSPPYHPCARGRMSSPSGLPPLEHPWGEIRGWSVQGMHARGAVQSRTRTDRVDSLRTLSQERLLLMATLQTPMSLPASPRPPSRPRMNSALTLVTPDKAQALLATAYQGQRPLRPHHVRFLRHLLRTGHWRQGAEIHCARIGTERFLVNQEIPRSLLRGYLVKGRA